MRDLPFFLVAWDPGLCATVLSHSPVHASLGESVSDAPCRIQGDTIVHETRHTGYAKQLSTPLH